MSERFDSIVVGSGPNGLAAAVVLTCAGLSVRVYEAAETAGGGCRTEELTLAGFRHDVCSAAHPLAAGSSYFRRFALEDRGVRLLQPAVAFAHPLDGGRAGAVVRSVEATAASLGDDEARYAGLFAPLVHESDAILDAVLSSMRRVPRAPIPAATFALRGVRSAASIASRFSTPEARALFGGVAAHAGRRLDRAATGGVGLLLGMLAHSVGWPVIEGGSVRLATAMIEAIESGGGEVVTGTPIRRLADLPPARATLLDVSPRDLIALSGETLPAIYRRQIERFRFGPGICKVDWALSEPVPWTADVCRQAGTLHLGGSFEEIARAELDVAAGRHPQQPYVLCAQAGVVDSSRAPAGKHALWTYCHVPSGSTRDMSDAIAGQVERFAPGFREVVLAKAVRSAAEEKSHNSNFVGGDISGGVQDLWQTFARPVTRWNPYRTPIKGVYLCSSSTPPGAGVHGRCGELAALTALRDVFGIRRAPDLAPSSR